MAIASTDFLKLLTPLHLPLEAEMSLLFYNGKEKTIKNQKKPKTNFSYQNKTTENSNQNELFFNENFNKTEPKPLFLIQIYDDHYSHLSHSFTTEITLAAYSSVILIEYDLYDEMDQDENNDKYKDKQEHEVIKTTIKLMKGATLQHFHFTQGNPDKFHKKFAVELQENSTYEALHLPLISKENNTTYQIDLMGEGAVTEFYTAILPCKAQKNNLHLEIHHHSPHCESKCITRQVLDKNAKGKIQGKIIVHPNTHGSLAHFESKSLLLSETAEMKTEPQFEIYHDDVNCTHGAALGFIDQEALFYLTSRGIPVDIAEKLLINAFLDPILKKLKPDNPLPSSLSSLSSLSSVSSLSSLYLPPFIEQYYAD